MHGSSGQHAGTTALAQPSPGANSPFIVGVSGHRDLSADDLPRLRDAVAAFVEELKRHLPDTELRIIVGMAEGADLLVAREALDRGVAVEAVLPMPLPRYAADFDADTLVLLEELLRRPNVRRVELAPPFEPAADGARHSAAERDAIYANLMRTLVRRSSLLVALWDGRVSNLPGGTADTVLRYLGLRSDDDRELAAIEFVESPAELDVASHLVYWAPAPREGGATAADIREPCFLTALGDNVLHMQRTMPRQLERQLAELNTYNRDYLVLSAQGRLRDRDSLLAALPADIRTREQSALQDIDGQYAKADALAVHYQVRSDRLFGLFGVTAFTMGTAYLAYEKLVESRLLLVAYVVLLLVGLGLYYSLKGRHWFAKHLSYRALAETMRVTFYLRLAGADADVDPRAVLALSGIDRFHGFGWISFVLKSAEPADRRAPGSRPLDADQTLWVEHAWIESQHRYFTSKVRRLERYTRWVTRLRNSVLAFFLVAIAIMFLFGHQLVDIPSGLGVSLRNLLTFAVGFLAILLGVWELHHDKMATRELLWQYRNQLEHFSHARRQLARITAPGRRSEILADLGTDSLMESYLWTIHRYHREHEPPAGR